MSGEFRFHVEEAVTKRYSVRTYDKKNLDQEMKRKIIAYAAQISNPLGPKIRIQFIDTDAALNGKKLGTYGIISGARTYMAVTVPNVEYAAEALGYEFEQIVLYAASLGLGTCWLGGTFNRSAFASQIEVGENEVFAILSPVGYPAQKKRFSEHLFRQTLKADGRKGWSELFYEHGFDRPLTKEAAGAYQFPLEMLRLAPSAVNKQPWRIVVTENAVHFFEKQTMGGEVSAIDMQRIDVGIGICHFLLAAVERKLQGRLERKCPDMDIPKGMTYIASWMKE